MGQKMIRRQPQTVNISKTSYAFLKWSPLSVSKEQNLLTSWFYLLRATKTGRRKKEKKKNQTSYIRPFTKSTWLGESEQNICNKTELPGPSYLHLDQHPATPTRHSSRKPLLSTHARDHPLSIQGQDHGYFPSGYTTSPVFLATVSFSTASRHPANPDNKPAGQSSARVTRYITAASDTLASPSFRTDLLQLALKGTQFLVLLLPYSLVTAS